MRFVLKEGATGQPLAVTAYQGTGARLNLTGCTVTFTMKDRTGAVKVNAAAVDLTNAVNGEMEYRWVSTDVDTVGTFLGTFRIVLGSGKPLTLPAEGYIEVVVEDA